MMTFCSFGIWFFCNPVPEVSNYEKRRSSGLVGTLINIFHYMVCSFLTLGSLLNWGWGLAALSKLSLAAIC